MVENDLFQLLGVFDLVKSESGQQHIIRGRILHGVKDADGETPVLDWFDWGPFDKTGYVKYEHDPFTIKKSKGEVEVTSHPTPANQIGVPLRRIRKGNEVFVEAALLPKSKMAEEVIALDKSIQEHNKNFPNNKRHLQFSIEGQRTRLDKKTGRYGGRILNVVVTPQGVDESTFATIEARNSQVMKSLAAGYATAPGDMKDGEAIRKQSLEGSTKNLTNIGEDTMKDKFASRNEAFQVYKSRGMKDEDAKKAVNEYFTKKKEDEDKNNTDMEKCFTSKSEHLTKSVEAAQALAALSETVGTEITKINVDLEKSLAAIREGKEIDGLAYLGENTSAVNTVAKLIKDGFTQMAKSFQSLAEAMAQDSLIQKSVIAKVQDMGLDLEKSVGVQDKVVMALSRTQHGISVVDGTEKVVPATPAEGEKPEDLTKSINTLWGENWLTGKAEAAASAGETEKAKAYYNAQNEVNLHQSLAVLNKSVLAEMVKDFEATHKVN